MLGFSPLFRTPDAKFDALIKPPCLRGDKNHVILVGVADTEWWGLSLTSERKPEV